MKKEELIRAVDKMAIYDKDYEVLTALVSMNDDKFLVKVIEEVALGTIRFVDFYRLFSDARYGEMVERNLEAQQRLKEEIERTIAFRKKFESPDYSIDPSTTMIGVTIQDDDSPAKAFYDSSESLERRQLVYDLLSPDPSDDPVTSQSKLSVYEAFSRGDISKEDLLLFARDYIVPISYQNQVLNGSDRSFMVENNLTEDQMKKIKSLSAFLRRRDSL